MIGAALQQMWCPMCEMMMGGWGWWGMILMGLFWLIVIGLVIWLVYRMVKAQGWMNGPTERPDSAEEILRERYARGEIDRDSYERMQEDLRRG